MYMCLGTEFLTKGRERFRIPPVFPLGLCVLLLPGWVGSCHPRPQSNEISTIPRGMFSLN